jgi:hypothetical protein
MNWGSLTFDFDLRKERIQVASVMDAEVEGLTRQANAFVRHRYKRDKI